MARNQEAFNETLQELKRLAKMHNKPFWLVPSADKYHVSVIKPRPDELPYGTCAILYNAQLEEQDKVVSSVKLQFANKV